MDSSDEYSSVAHPFASVYWGLVISLLLGGVAFMQAYIYFTRAKDHFLIKLMAVSMLILDVAESALVSYSVYFYLVPRFGSTSNLAVLPTTMAVECLTATLITIISQLFYVYQLIGAKKMGKGSWGIIATIVVLSLLSLAGSIACAVTMTKFRQSVLQNRNRVFEITFGISKGFGSATDIVATIAMCLFLNSVRTGMNKTNSLLDSLIHLVLNRGILVTVAQTLLLVTFYASSNTLVWVLFHVNVPKLYVNTFFGMLNARDRIRTKHLGTAVKLTDTEASHRKAVSDFGPAEHETLVEEAQSQNEKMTLPSSHTHIVMNTTVTTTIG